MLHAPAPAVMDTIPLWRVISLHSCSITNPVSSPIVRTMHYVRVLLGNTTVLQRGGRARGHVGVCPARCRRLYKARRWVLWWLSSCSLTRVRRRRWYTAALLLRRLVSWCARHTVFMYLCKKSKSCVPVHTLVSERGPRPTHASGSWLGGPKDMPWIGTEKASRDASKHARSANRVWYRSSPALSRDPFAVHLPLRGTTIYAGSSLPQS